jgi:hypothetical protein
LRGLPDFKRIVFDPAWPRKYLVVFFLIRSHDIATVVEENEPIAGRSQIQCANVVDHIAPQNRLDHEAFGTKLKLPVSRKQ